LRGAKLDEAVELAYGGYLARFEAAMNDDFNMPVAFSVLFDVARDINKHKDNLAEAGKLAGVLKKLGAIVGLLQTDPNLFMQGGAVEALIVKRNTARANKNWADADAARDELNALGVVLEDSAQGTTWRKA
jgi:cysteinyl-tRNA synthetase